MITYVHCLSSAPVVSCWHRACNEDPPGEGQAPLSFHPTDKMGNRLQSEAYPSARPPRNEGCLRKRLLSVSKVHQKQDTLWTPKPLLGPLVKSPSGKTQTSHDDQAVSSLDEESKWAVHYTAPWHQQENVFLPGSRPPCVEDLHRQAKVNLKSALRECDKLRKDGFRSSQYYSQGPVFSDDSLHQHRNKFPAPSSSDDASVSGSDVSSARPRSPVSESDGTKGSSLPTPEERMRQTARAVPTDIVAINVTGAVFDRQASVRRSLVGTDTVPRRPKKVKRRKTISGMPDRHDDDDDDGHCDVHPQSAAAKGLDLRPHSMFLPGQYWTLGRAGSVNSAPLRRSRTRDSGCQTDEVKVVPPSVRRIRAQRGHGIAAQMAASSSAASVSVCGADPSPSASLPRRGARVSLGADPLYSSTPVKIGNLRADDAAVRMRRSPRTDAPPRPRSQEVRRTPSGDWGGGPACAASPDAAYSAWLIPDATLPRSARTLALAAASGRSAADALVGRSATCPSLATPESSASSQRWMDGDSSTAGDRLEESSRAADCGSLHSQDNDGYYTSMHLDSGLRRHGDRPARHSMYEWRRTSSADCDEDAGSYGERSLSRSISLRKSRKPPAPPARTDSLRRKPAGAKKPLGGAPDPGLIASLQRSLQLGLRLAEGPPDGDDPWVRRSPSSAGAANGVADAYSLCHVTPTHSDSGSLPSDYADDYAELATPTPAAEKADVSSGRRERPGTPVREETSKPSPERARGPTSPSSGYSSQSNTPSAGTPVPSGIRSASPLGARPRPKVPERKSSLLSSLSGSSSSTSLSSVTSDSLKASSSAPATPTPFPPPPPGCSTSPEFPPPPSDEMLFCPALGPPPPPPLPASPAKKAAAQDQLPDAPVFLITPFALRSVRLRSVPRARNATGDRSPPALLDGPSEDSDPSPVCELVEELSLEGGGHQGGAADEGEVDERRIEEARKALASDDGGGSPVKKKPPVMAKKPKLSFVPSPGGDANGAAPPPEETRQQSCETAAEISGGSDTEVFYDDDDDDTADSNSSKDDDDDAGDVFDETSPDGTPETETGAMVTPTRTTEDLFAAIHRSKRKVLGRKESEEDKPRSGSPPPTPPRGSPAPRPSGSIQRPLRKSSTSSDNFKALLLKKGSRADGAFRMSAADMLRSTDPRCQRRPASSDERGRYEALSSSSPPAALKYGRSRAPPSAASSKYNARSRILSSPMTVICERDGEDAGAALSDRDGGR
ncbi:NHS-like protein 1 isoform X2 [Festucalex cinctus]